MPVAPAVVGMWKDGRGYVPILPFMIVEHRRECAGGIVTGAFPPLAIHDGLSAGVDSMTAWTIILCAVSPLAHAIAERACRCDCYLVVGKGGLAQAYGGAAPSGTYALAALAEREIL